jgi:hypothetical protein
MGKVKRREKSRFFGPSAFRLNTFSLNNKREKP